MIKEKPFFSRLFSYQQRENHSPLENYLIEILTYCLENDKAFRDEFRRLLGGIDLPEEEFRVSSQYVAGKDSRPDIVIETDNTIILIECKVESSENPDQLNRYSSYLQKNHQKKEKHLIYLTKYFDQKDIPRGNDYPRFQQLRWHEIYTIINKDHQQITKELKKLLKAYGMEDPKNFSIEDLLALKTISSTISKMDEVLAYFSKELTDKFKGCSTYSSRSSKLAENGYSNYVSLKNDGIEYWLSIGFYWWEDKWDYPQVGIILSIPTKAYREDGKFDEFKTNFHQPAWTHFERGEHRICYVKPLSTFLHSETNDHFTEIKIFLENGLKEIYELKKNLPLAFEKT